MNFAYGWAFARPVRKVYYNLVITGLSIAVAFLIGTIEIVGLLSAELHIHGRFWDLIANFNINEASFIADLFRRCLDNRDRLLEARRRRDKVGGQRRVTGSNQGPT